MSWSIIGWNSIVGPWSRVEGIPNPTPDMYVNKIRKGVCIVGAYLPFLLLNRRANTLTAHLSLFLSFPSPLSQQGETR